MIGLPYQILGGLALVGLVGFASYQKGSSTANRECEYARQAEALLYAEEFQREVERGNELSRQYEETKRTALQRNSRMVSSSTRLAPCGSVSNGLVWLHNSSASKTFLPEPSSESTCKASPITSVEFSRVMVENYGLCNNYIDQLNALIEWHEKK